MSCAAIVDQGTNGPPESKVWCRAMMKGMSPKCGAWGHPVQCHCFQRLSRIPTEDRMRRRHIFRFITLASIAVLALGVGRTWAQGATAPIGVFEGHGDVGTVLHAGSVEFDKSKGTYTLTGSGEN